MNRNPAELKADIAQGLADVADGRLTDFDPERIIARGLGVMRTESNTGEYPPLA
ncbi:MAG TPA: hypothetical protein VG225_03205 [Terracidiphilus sp.]|jgi:hypothetical protein|nr:hypothetical protein [Terracidiphilus sp.]